MFDNRNNMIVVRKHRRPGLRPFYFSSDFDDLFEGFRGEMEKLARDPWTVAERNPTLRTYHRQNMMPMDFRDAGDRYMLSVELPGVDKDDVKIRMDDDILTLKVEGREEKGDYDESIDSSDPRRANESGDSSHLRRGISSESVGSDEEEFFVDEEDDGDIKKRGYEVVFDDDEFEDSDGDYVEIQCRCGNAIKIPVDERPYRFKCSKCGRSGLIESDEDDDDFDDEDFEI